VKRYDINEHICTSTVYKRRLEVNTVNRAYTNEVHTRAHKAGCPNAEERDSHILSGRALNFYGSSTILKERTVDLNS
jgi:hypothetical protein